MDPFVGWKLKQENIIFLSGVGEIEMMGRSGKRKMEVGAVWGAARRGQRGAGWFLGRGRKGKEKEETGQQRFFFGKRGRREKSDVKNLDTMEKRNTLKHSL